MDIQLKCDQCGVLFSTNRKGKKFCTQGCYFKSKKRTVTLMCEVCNGSFDVAYRFRGTKTCSKPCTSKLLSRQLKTRVTKLCLACGSSYDVVPSYEEKAKYCSYDCFLSTRNTRQPSVTKVCEYCKKEFVVQFTRKNQRFCGRSCANSGDNNFWFGKTGPEHPFYGRKAWNNGLTINDDHRVKDLGRKISKIAKQAFIDGTRSNVGERNPNFGNTSDTLTPEKRRNFSRAAVDRILRGVSGYNTKHLSGEFKGIKSMCIVRFKSSWELAAMMMWDIDDNIISYEYEPQVFKLSDGRRAIPDFLVLKKDGTREYVEIKPTSIQQIPEIEHKLELVRKSVEKITGLKYVLFGTNEFNTCKALLGERFVDAIKCYKDRC